MEFAEFLRKSMKLLHMSHRDMARVIGMSVQSVDGYSAGSRCIPARTKIVIAHNMHKEFDSQIKERCEKIDEIWNEINEIERLKSEAGEWL